MYGKRIILAAAFTAAVGLTGCISAAKGPAFTPEKNISGNQGVVYISREKALVGSMMAANIDINGKKSAALEQGGYIVIIAPRGTLTVRVYAGLFDKTVKINVKKGKSSLLRMAGTDIRLVDRNNAAYSKELAAKVLQKKIVLP